MKKKYNKLVRDRIPEIIEQQGKSLSYRIADPDEFRIMIRSKLLEEVQELIESEGSLEELADVLEVPEALLETLSMDQKMELIQIKSRKQADRGSFSEKLILESVTESDK